MAQSGSLAWPTAVSYFSATQIQLSLLVRFKTRGAANRG
jgi:hypothetical protein